MIPKARQADHQNVARRPVTAEPVTADRLCSPSSSWIIEGWFDAAEALRECPGRGAERPGTVESARRLDANRLGKGGVGCPSFVRGFAVDNGPVSEAWCKAAEDLGIEVVAPFSAELPGGHKRQFVALVKRFGTANGTLINLLSDSFAGTLDEDGGFAEQLGFCYSQLNPACYEVYEREHFIDTLIDWGWADAERTPPDWYPK
jgi:hypothetical protein